MTENQMERYLKATLENTIHDEEHMDKYGIKPGKYMEELWEYSGTTEEHKCYEDMIDDTQWIEQELYDDLRDDFHNCGGWPLARWSDIEDCWPFMTDIGRNDIIKLMAQTIIGDIKDNYKEV